MGFLDRMIEKQKECNEKYINRKKELSEQKEKNKKDYIETMSALNGLTEEEYLEKKNRKKNEKERIKQLERDKIPYCPKCHSTSITYQGKKISIGKAIAGGVLLGPGGTVLGGLSGKKGKVVCLNCGHKWKL